jgi:hypothetical protein
MTQSATLQAQLFLVHWLTPWQPVTGERAVGLERVLSRELCSGHPLEGRTARAVAARVDCDDVLYWVDGPEELVVVHLTRRKPRTFDAASCMCFDSVDGFVEACLQPDHLEYMEPDDG